MAGLDARRRSPRCQGQECPEGVTGTRISVNVRSPEASHRVRLHEWREAIGLPVEQPFSKRPQSVPQVAGDRNIESLLVPPRQADGKAPRFEIRPQKALVRTAKRTD